MESDLLFPEPLEAQETLLACLREACVTLDDAQQRRDGELARRRERAERHTAWLREQQESGKTPTYQEWSRMMDEADPSGEELNESLRRRREQKILATVQFLRITACLLTLRASGTSLPALEQLHQLLAEVRRLRAAPPLDDPERYAQMTSGILAGLQGAQSMSERIRSLSPDAGSEKAMAIVVEQTKNKQPASNQLQEFLEARNARQKRWREQQRRLLEVALHLSGSLPASASDTEEPWLTLPPPGAELVAHVEAAVAMLREEAARHRHAHSTLRPLRTGREPAPTEFNPKPIGLFFERGWNLHLHAIYTRCEEILLAQPPERRAEVRAVYESLARFRLCRATEPSTDNREPKPLLSPEQIMADLERGFAELDRQWEAWEEQQIALLTAALEQARRLAVATRGS